MRPAENRKNSVQLGGEAPRLGSADGRFDKTNYLGYARGMKKCQQCGQGFPLRLTLNGKRHNLQRRRYCLECSPFGSGNRKKLGQDPAKRYVKKSEKHIRWQRKARHQRKKTLLQLLGGRCSVCGYNKCMGALDFHHRDPSTKSFNLASNGLLGKWDIVVAEAQKCIILCRNCHAELHYQQELHDI